MITIDFETRSEADLIKVGAWAYAEHPSTDILCLAMKLPKQMMFLKKGDVKFRADSPAHQQIAGWVREKRIFEAHNAFFEQAIWYNIMHKRHSWPNIPIAQWRCSAAKASAHALPRALGKAAEALCLPIQKDMQGRNIMLKMCKPRRPTKYDKSKWHESANDFRKLYEYCMQDVATEEKLSAALRPLTESEQSLWTLDQVINRRGIMIDLEAVEAALDIAEKRTKQLNGQVRAITKGVLTNLTQIAKAQMWIEGRGIDMGGFTKQDVEDTLKLEDLPKDIEQVLKIRQEVSKTSTKKFDALQRAACNDGRIRDAFMFHGASTGRWSGKLVQFQNLPRGSIKEIDSAIEMLKRRDIREIEFFYGNVFEFLSSLIRSMIISAPGNDLIVADYAAIEARVLSWLANDTKGLKDYKEGVDRYVNMAAVIYDIRPSQVTKDQRQLGKQAILGCGYQMGAGRFRETCATYGMEITKSLAEKAVQAYRQSNSAIKAYWYAMEQAAVEAVRSGRIVQAGRVRYGVHKGFLYCILPSQRAIAYYNPQLEEAETPWGETKLQLTYMGVDSKTRQWTRLKTYGGMLTENVTQAVARDLLADAMKRCERAGYKIVMHVHDELVCEVPEDFGSVKEFEKLMAELPEWAGGMPVVAEGWRGKRYKK